MSVIAMSWVWKTSRSAGPARLVLLAIADVANDEGECSAYARSVAVLARKCRMSEPTVRKSIKALQALGELTVTARGGGRISNDYQMLMAPPGGNGVTPCPQQAFPQGVTSLPPISPSLSVDTPSTSAAPAAPAQKSRPRDLLFEAVAEACGIDWRGGLTGMARGQLARSVKELRAVEATVEEVGQRARTFRVRYRGLTLTPTALTKHWPQLAGEATTTVPRGWSGIAEALT